MVSMRPADPSTKTRSAIRHWLKDQVKEEVVTTASAHNILELIALTRPNLLPEITLLVAQSGLTMTRFQAEPVNDNLTRIEVSLENVSEQLLAKLRQVEGIQQVMARLEKRPSTTFLSANPHTLRPVSGDGFFGRRAELMAEALDTGDGQAVCPQSATLRPLAVCKFDSRRSGARGGRRLGT